MCGRANRRSAAPHLSSIETPMLVLSRRTNEAIVINENIQITVVDIRGDKVRLGIEAPREMSVHRREVFDVIRGGSPVPPDEPPPALSTPVVPAEPPFFG